MGTAVVVLVMILVTSWQPLGIHGDYESCDVTKRRMCAADSFCDPGLLVCLSCKHYCDQLSRYRACRAYCQAQELYTTREPSKSSTVGPLEVSPALLSKTEGKAAESGLVLNTGAWAGILIAAVLPVTLALVVLVVKRRLSSNGAGAPCVPRDDLVHADAETYPINGAPQPHKESPHDCHKDLLPPSPSHHQQYASTTDI